MPSNEDVTQMASLLLALTQPDTNTIRQAELTLKPILKDERSIPALLEVLKGRGSQVSREHGEDRSPTGCLSWAANPLGHWPSSGRCFPC